MKANCPECGQEFDVGEHYDDKRGVSIPCTPFHPPVEGKRVSHTKDERTGFVVDVHCAGSLRPTSA